MSHTSIDDIAGGVSVQSGAIVSKVIHHGEGLDVTVFAIDAGQGLTEHTASRAAIVQVISGRLTFTVDGQALDARPGFWLHMAPGAPHALTAMEPTVMLLTLVGA
jgi:quercetin dioxygenase-like cupin family protein